MVMEACPKCGSMDIDRGEIVRSGSPKGSIGYLSYGKKGFLPIGGAITSYVCLSCGYLETYYIDLDRMNPKL